MNKKHYTDLIKHCKKFTNVKYVYGTKYEILTQQKFTYLQNLYGKTYVWDSDKSKIGKRCCDCSGMISSCTGIVKNSLSYYQTANEIKSISELKRNWNKYVGWAIYKKGHIGVVSDKEGYYYAMEGSKDNFVHRKISFQNWVCILKLNDIDYSIKESENVSRETYFKKYTGKSNSIVDILKSLGIDSTFNYRKKIAKANNIPDYKGTAQQNLKLCEYVKNGVLKKP